MSAITPSETISAQTVLLVNLAERWSLYALHARALLLQYVWVAFLGTTPTIIPVCRVPSLA